MLGERHSLSLIILLILCLPLHGRGEDSDQADQAEIFGTMADKATQIGRVAEIVECCVTTYNSKALETLDQMQIQMMMMEGGVKWRL